MDEIAQKLTASIGSRYRIERLLGAGGMANVYLAEDVPHGRSVAIKVMRPEVADAIGPERFLREIQLLARLQHPHILGLVDSGEAAGALFYVMPYLQSGSLRARLERERELPIADALQILREVAGALEYAHREGVVHRDIKPENILFSAGHAQVADFGIARIVSGSVDGTALTTPGLAIGTPQYMAPEQAAGDPRLDHRADLYAFGALAYEILSGAPPFVASTAAQVMAMVLAEEPVPLSKRRPAVPAPLESLIMRCLHKRPADRCQSAAELVAGLERAIPTDHGAAHVSGDPSVVTAHFPITEALARRLDRENFDPAMIGDSLEYFDNRVASDVLVMLMNAIWLDGSDFEPHLRRLPYRCIAPTMFGFEPRARQRFVLSLRDHIVLLEGLLRAKIEECRPSLVIVSGFSASGDLVLKLAASIGEGERAPDGVLALGPNQGIETCFVSEVLAHIESNDPAHMLAAFRRISAAAESIDDWLLLNGYVGRIMTRFRHDMSPLRKLGRDIVEPFEREGPSAFAAMYRAATERARLVRCVFEDSKTCRGLLRTTLTDHMDRGVLGKKHRDGSLLIDPTLSHFDLLQPDRIASHLAAMVEELQGRG